MKIKRKESLVTTTNTMICTGYLVFIIIVTSCIDRASQQLLCNFAIWFWQKSFSSEKKQSKFGSMGDASARSKSLKHGFPSCPSWPVIKLVPFSSLRNSKCLYALPLYYSQIGTQTLRNFHIGASSVNVKQYSMPFPNFLRR